VPPGAPAGNSADPETNVRIVACCLLCVTLLGLVSCEYDEEKPIFMAPGSYGDIAVVVSDEAMMSAVDDLKAAMNEEFTFVLARETRFNFDVFPPDQVKLCEGYKNIIFLWRVGDGGPMAKRLRGILSDVGEQQADRSRTGVRLDLKNPFASYQIGVVLAASDRNSLLSFARRQAAELSQVFETKSSERIMRRYRYEGLDTQLMNDLWLKHRFWMEIPAVYRINQHEPDGYPGVELIQNEPSRGITVAWSHSVDPMLIMDHQAILLELRKEMGLKMHGEDIAEDFLTWRRDTVGDLPAWRVEGAWTSRRFEGGGPFWSWFVADPDNQRVICIDALCYAPGLNKMDYFRRMRTIVQTFTLERPQS